MTPDGRAELRALVAKAAPGVWSTRPSDRSPGLAHVVIPNSMHPTANLLDAELIVAAVNALPALLDALDQVETELRHTRNNLDQARYGRTQGDLAITRVRELLDRHKSQEIYVDDVYAALDGDQ